VADGGREEEDGSGVWVGEEGGEEIRRREKERLDLSL
jgi:hypothetical protein